MTHVAFNFNGENVQTNIFRHLVFNMYFTLVVFYFRVLLKICQTQGKERSSHCSQLNLLSMM